MFYPHYQWVSSLYALTVRHGLDVAPGLEDWPLGFSEPQRMAYRLVTTQESESPTGHRIPKTYPRHPSPKGSKRCIDTWTPGRWSWACNLWDRQILSWKKCRFDTIQLMLFRLGARIFSGCDCLSRMREQKMTEISPTSFSFSAVAGHHLRVARIALCFWVLLTPEAQEVSETGTWRDKNMTLDQLNFILGFKRQDAK